MARMARGQSGRGADACRVSVLRGEQRSCGASSRTYQGILHIQR
uniref:Uncharacterized protein n=1 Tax=Ascaris lumbricoides TaxID=6252 RepID=A0A0M3IXP8_ASCLU